jgi:hypothetical protein
MFATILGYFFPIVGVSLVGLAAASYVYIPVVGRVVAVVLLVAAAGTFAFDGGYRYGRGLDKSAVLQADNAELQRELEDAKTVAANAAAAETAASASADANQQKVDSYVAQLSKTPTCGLSPDDVKRLLGIQ